jgi:WD40 repeat protein
MADLQELLQRLNGGGASGGNHQQLPSSQQQHPHYQQPSVSSPIFSPAPSGPAPHHPSHILSPNMSSANTPAPEHGAGSVSQQTPQQQSANLLNLLRFNQPGLGQRSVSQQPPPQQPPVAPAHGRTVSASDFVAGFMGNRSGSQGSVPAVPSGLQSPPVPAASENPQDLLLRLLNHPKPSQSPARSSHASAAAFSPPVLSHMPETAVDELAQDLADAVLESAAAEPSDNAAAHFFGNDGPAIASRAPEPASLAPKFTYVNPFDQLAAASPRNRTPVAEAPRALPKMQILQPKHVLQAAAADEAPSHPHETVAEAVSDLGEQVNQQIEEALAEAEGKSMAQMEQELNNVTAEEVKEIEETIVDIATEITKELEEESNKRELEQAVPKPLAAALQQVAAEVADADVVENWETAEAEESLAKGEDQTVTVYRFPMRAFASITVNDMPPRRLFFQPELFMDIARIKKDFDQIDRSLVSASKNFIVYTLTKKGGFRIIRQENGNYRQVFENHQERIFNIAICNAGDDAQQSLESILGIGVNGTVFWTSIDPAREDQFGENLDSQGLLLPPSPSQDDNTSGGQLKTRAKPSSRHPEFFAVGRGKSIHIVFPRIAASYVRQKSRICHTEKYLKERSLKILTGKAGKDFTFSEDDTVIVSLDKAGRMRFWDIRTLTDPELGIPGSAPKNVEVSDTLLEFHTTTPNAKSWPTSVFFFDKDKPYTKGIALRYVMVGMKQNHSFQLWDLGLGKAVQEINLPHGNESDAICSVSFHPKTGIMAVAHPTRNSIFFVHVSCPRYNLPLLSQAEYISRLANKGALPPVNATAIMTSITEYSFASKGQIRSLHMLNEPAGPVDADDADNAALFELYVMHSKGVCVLRIRRSDLGWKKEIGEPLNPKEAEEEGIISISQLKPPAPVTATGDESSTAGDAPAAPRSVSDRSVRESTKKENSTASRQSMTTEAAMRASTLAKVESKQDAARAAIINGGAAEKSEKKKKKRTAAETASQASTSTRATPSSYAQIAQAPAQAKSPAPEPVPTPAAAVAPAQTAESSTAKTSDAEIPEWAKQLMGKYMQQSAPAPVAAAAPAEFDEKKLEQLVSSEITKGFSRELDVMYKRFDEDKRVMNAANGAKQEAILRLVSSTLTENVEGVIRKMVDENIRNVLLPEVLAKTSSTLEQSIGSNLKTALGPQLSKEIPDAVSRALKAPQLFQNLSDQVAKKVSSGFEPVVVASVGSVVNPAIAKLTNTIEQQIGEQLRQSQVQRREDAAKITQLTDTVHTCLETIQSMVATQTELQAQITKLQQSIAQPPSRAPSQAPTPRRQAAPPKQKTPEELEIESITRLLTEGNYEQGTMQWLQSPRTDQLFDAIFVRCNPAYLAQVSPLLVLSTGAVVSEPLDRNLEQRLAWLDAVLQSVNPQVSHSPTSIHNHILTNYRTTKSVTSSPRSWR